MSLFTDTEVILYRARAIGALPAAWQSRWRGPLASAGVLQPVFTRGRLRVLVAVEDKQDGGTVWPWLHVSVSQSGGKLPGYSALVEVRRCFIPAALTAVEVWPPASEHYSVAEVRHLWCRLTGPPTVPDLRMLDEGRLAV